MNNVTKSASVKSSQYRNLILLALMVMVVLGFLVLMLSGQSKEDTNTVEKGQFDDPTKRVDAEPVILERLQKSLDDIRKQTESLKQDVAQQIQSANNTNTEQQKKYDERIAALEKELSGNQSHLAQTNADFDGSAQGALPGSEIYHNRVISNASSYPSNRREDIVAEDTMREDKIHLSAMDTDLPAAIKNPDSYVPAGTFVKAVMLGGADTAASVASSSNPEVMLFRVIEEGTLPNHKKSHLKGCIALASVYGDISSERGMIRVENLSCVFPNDEVVDQKIKGSVFGPEGKYGVRGKPMWRETALLERAFAAGTLSGLSTGLSQTYTTNSISADGNVQTINPGKIFQYGAASGAGKAMDKLAEYNIKRAEQYHPVIQLSAGTIVDIVFQEGFFLDGKKREKDEIASHSTTTQLFKNESMPAAHQMAESEPMLPLTEEQVKKIQENSKELGFTVRGNVS